MPQLSPAFDEIEKQFKTEFDYRGEMRNAKEIRENLKKEFPDIIGEDGRRDNIQRVSVAL